MKKRIFGIFLFILLAIFLTGCQESTSAKYDRASKLLNEGKYLDAAAVFDEISAYEDASKMSMYAKAINAAESGDYETAFSTFANLGDFKDCPMMVTYYTARQKESLVYDAEGIHAGYWFDAIDLYGSNPLFRDSKDRAEACRKAAYDQAVSSGDEGNVDFALFILDGLGAYNDAETQKIYYQAAALLKQDDFSGASAAYKSIPGFRDADTLAASVMDDGYNTAAGLEAEGILDAAHVLFLNLGDYKDAATRAYKLYYDAGIAAQGEQDWDGAVALFTKANGYSDAAVQISETRYQEASAKEAAGDQEGAYSLFMSLVGYNDSFERANKPYYDLGVAKREAGEWDAAVAAFEHAGDYSDSKTQISETRYQEASALEAAGNQEGAYKLFMSLGDYSNSFERANKPYYELGIAKREAGEWDAAVAAFEHAGEYSDAKEQIPATRYVEGLAKRDAQDWDGAVTAFGNAGEYNDAAEQVFVTYYTEGLTKRDAQDWDGAVTAFGNAGEYSDAAEQVLVTYYMEGMKKRETKDWDDAVTAFGNAGEYIDAPEQITETWYQKATDLETSGKYDDAYAMLKTIRGYRDVDSLLKNNENFVAIHEAMLEPFRSVGNVVTFGRYEQDNNTGNGPEEIEWIVLDYDEANHKALLLSRYGLEVMAYNKEYTDITWEKCTLRTWLNGEFLDKAFSTAEQSAILMTKLDNSKSQGYSKWNTDGGNNTEDRIFLLSYAEANRYLGVTNDDTSNLKSRVAPTAYALAHGAWIDIYKTEEGAAAGWWWLRSPGSYQDHAAVVSLLGSLYHHNVYGDSDVVRPTFWINLESDIF